QPHVLDRDDRLVGERLQQRDLVVGEGPGLRAPYADRPKRGTVAQHGDAEATAQADLPGELWICPFPIELDIGYVNHGALQDCPANNRSPIGSTRDDATLDGKR